MAGTPVRNEKKRVKVFIYSTSTLHAYIKEFSCSGSLLLLHSPSSPALSCRGERWRR